MGGDDHGRADRREPRQPVDQRALSGAIEAASRLIETDQPRRIAAGPSTGHRDRQRQSLSFASGEVPCVATGVDIEAGDAQRLRPGLARQLVADPLADEVVVGPLGQQGTPPGRLDRAVGRVEGRGSGAHQRALAGAVGADQGDELTRIDPQVDGGEDLAGTAAGVELDREAGGDQSRLFPGSRPRPDRLARRLGGGGRR